jgi:hypothetical protein
MGFSLLNCHWAFSAGRFYRMPLPETRQPPNLRRTRDLERSNFRQKRPPASEATLANPAAEGGTMGEKWPRNFADSGDFHVTFGFFYMPYSTTWDRRFYFPSEGRRAEDFFARKIRRRRPGLNPRTWVPKASTLPLDHRNRLYLTNAFIN